ncbi:hypothetical protein [Spiroplasma endosymbiont of Diplazon laetatorius]|uniref:hypothetical protein n=1 Tax=Spiroplasma endosymbiont of Diplazon laetatorius TaxID=3066322 RepID=UPI0030CE4EE6
MNKKIKITIWYVFFIYFFGFLILSAVMAQLDPAPRYHVFGATNKVFADMAFWTTQTNWMFFIFFIFVALDGKWGLWKPGKVAWINFLAYFTLTMALFWSGLSATLSNQNIDTNPLVSYANVYNTFIKWFITVTTHLFTYIIAITYYIVAVRKEKIDIRSWYKKDLLIGWIYPIFYLCFVTIRMLIMFKIGSEHYMQNISDKENQWLIENNYEWVKELGIGVLATPYFFFNPLVEINGLELMIFGTIGCLLLITCCQYLMILLNNWLTKEKIVNQKEKEEIPSLVLEQKIVSIVKMSINLVFIGLILYKMTSFENYNFANKIPALYYFVYPALYIFAFTTNIMSIVYTSLRLTGRYKNPSMEFLTSLFSGFFLLHFYALPSLILIPVTLERIYKDKKIPSI